MRICALILNWKQAEATSRCISALRLHAPDVDVLVVDNGSNDGSVQTLRSRHPEIPVVAHERNDGYAGGNNIGMRILTGASFESEIQGVPPPRPDAILVLNNDVQIHAGCVEGLRGAAEREPARGIFAPISFEAGRPGVIDFHRARIDLRYLAIESVDRGEQVSPSVDVESDYAPGSAFLIRSELAAQLGGFDDRFFLVWEDVDLSLRAAASGAGKPLMVADAHVSHEGSTTFGGAATPLYRYFYVRNSYLIARKHLRGIARWRALRMLDRRYAGWTLKTEDAELRTAIAQGAEDGRLGRTGPRAEQPGS